MTLSAPAFSPAELDSLSAFSDLIADRWADLDAAFSDLVEAAADAVGGDAFADEPAALILRAFGPGAWGLASDCVALSVRAEAVLTDLDGLLGWLGAR